MSAEDHLREDDMQSSSLSSTPSALELHGEEAMAGIRRMPVEKAMAIAERVFAEHAELFRRLAQ
jgi:hypothetical protein